MDIPAGAKSLVDLYVKVINFFMVFTLLYILLFSQYKVIHALSDIDMQNLYGQTELDRRYRVSKPIEFGEWLGTRSQSDYLEFD